MEWQGQYRYHLLSVSKHMVIGVVYLMEWQGQYRYHLLSVSKHMVIGVAYLVEWQGQYRYHLLSVGTYGNWSSVLGGVAKSVQVSLTVCV